MTKNTTLGLLALHHARAYAHLFPGDGREAAVIILCKRCEGPRTRLLSRNVLLVPHDECKRDVHQLTWPGQWIEQAIDLAEVEGLTILLMHSHPGGLFAFSKADDASDALTMPSLLEAFGPMHGSAVMTPDGAVIARLYQRDLTPRPIGLVTMANDQIHLWWHPASAGAGRRRPPMAFTSAMTQDLALLTVGVIGVSGTGSVIGEQALRAGFARVIPVEFDHLEIKNLNRVLNAFLSDAEAHRLKVDVYADAAAKIRPSCSVTPIPKSVSTRDAVLALMQADVIFVCVDSHEGRMVADRIAAAFMIPLFDMGVLIPTRKNEHGEIVIADVCGRIDYVFPGGSTLSDRGIYTPETLYAEDLMRSNPKAFGEQLAAGYIRGFPEQAPSVISLNLRAAAQAFNEFLARTYPFRQEPNSQYAQSRFSLAACEEDHFDESSFPRQMNPILGRGLTEPLLDLLLLAEDAT
jgi:hypothetical protein